MTDNANVAILTGAGSGVGAETLRLLRGQGTSVVAVDVAWPGAPVDDEGCITMTGDISDAGTWQTALEACRDRFGDPPDRLVLNAARLVVGTILELNEQDLRSVLDVNVVGAFLGMKACLPAMVARGGGTIVTVGSTASLLAEQGLAAYCASKGALLQLTRCVAVDHARDGIRANCVCPAAIDTPFFRRHVDAAPDPAAFLAKKQARHPSGRILQPADVARVIAFLLSDASLGMNGAAVTVDGGLLASFDFEVAEP